MRILKGLTFVFLIPFAFVLFLFHFLLDFACMCLGGILFGSPIPNCLDEFIINFHYFWFGLRSRNLDK